MAATTATHQASPPLASDRLDRVPPLKAQPIAMRRARMSFVSQPFRLMWFYGTCPRAMPGARKSHPVGVKNVAGILGELGRKKARGNLPRAEVVPHRQQSIVG